MRLDPILALASIFLKVEHGLTSQSSKSLLCDVICEIKIFLLEWCKVTLNPGVLMEKNEWTTVVTVLKIFGLTAQLQ